ncbi:MAG: HD domain-containing protein, partial [Rhodothermales bacterium]|nr:HD domain-containing protein [Rhodothermales bacterium]
ARRESYRSDSRKPVVEDGTLDDDQRRRDFTINAMAIGLNQPTFGSLLDPFDGLTDLKRRLIRTPLDAEVTFEDDPLRMVRAARFASQLRFDVDRPALDAMSRRADRIRIVSQERITDEVQKIVCSDLPSLGLKILESAGILSIVFPELVDLKGVQNVDGQRHKDNFYHTLQVLDNLVDMTDDRPCTDTEWLRWAALLHDIGKPATKRFDPGSGWTFHGHEERGARMIGKVFRRLRLPTDDRMAYVRKLIRLHHRPVSLVDDHVTDSAVRRLLFDAGDDVDDLMILVRADITSKNPRRVRRYLSAFDEVDRKMIEVEQKDRLRNFQPPVDGNEIMEVLSLPPSRLVGDLKEAIKDAILDGEILSVISRSDGFVLLSFFAIFLYYSIGIAKKVAGQDEETPAPASSMISATFMSAGGLAGLTLGGKWIVDSAASIGGALGMSEAMVGLTIVAIGTSLPELATSIMAAYRGSVDIAVGNVVGSNIFNVFFVLGISSTVKPLPFLTAGNVDILVVIFSNLALFAAMFTRKRRSLDRSEGAMLLLLYAGYLTYVVLRG